VATSQDPFAAEVIEDPYPLYEAVRHLGPVVWLRQYEAWFVTGHMEAKTVLCDSRTFSPIRATSEADVVLAQQLRPRRVLQTAADELAWEADRLVSSFTRCGAWDGALLAQRYVSEVLSGVIGLPADRQRDMLSVPLALEGTAFPGVYSDVLTPLSVTAHGVATALCLLATQPAEFAKLKAHTVTGRDVFHEALRYDPPVQAIARRATKPADFRGAPMQADDRIFLCLGAAGRDPWQWGPTAGSFLPDRRNSEEHLVLGTKTQLLPGSELTVTAAGLLLESVAERCSSLAPAGAPVAVRNKALRGWQSVPLQTAG
jgi:cytochrome P450